MNMEPIKQWLYDFWHKMFRNFTDDWFENLIVLGIGVAFGRFGAPWFV